MQQARLRRVLETRCRVPRMLRFGITLLLPFGALAWSASLAGRQVSRSHGCLKRAYDQAPSGPVAGWRRVGVALLAQDLLCKSHVYANAF